MPTVQTGSPSARINRSTPSGLCSSRFSIQARSSCSPTGRSVASVERASGAFGRSATRGRVARFERVERHRVATEEDATGHAPTLGR
jgi:hypothetical protein